MAFNIIFNIVGFTITASSKPEGKCLQPSPALPKSLYIAIKMTTYNFLTKVPARLRWRLRKLESSVLFHQQNIRHFVTNFMLRVAEQRNSEKHFNNNSEGKLACDFRKIFCRLTHKFTGHSGNKDRGMETLDCTSEQENT